MNKLLLSAIAALSVLPAFGQSKISGPSQLFLEQYRSDRQSMINTLGATDSEVPTVSVIAKIADNHSASELADAGYEIENDFGISAIVNLPIDQVETLAESDAVASISIGGTRRPMMDLARQASGVDDAHSGIEFNGTERSFTGKGVVLGLFDTGMDPNHVNFKDDNGTLRVKRLWHYDNAYSSAPTLVKPADIPRFSTDARTQTHATHVAGIMGGSYMGLGDYAYTIGNTLDQRRNQPMLYYGVAPESDLAFAVGFLGDPMILNGVEKIISHAESYGMPAVVNLSLGLTTGPHDGTDDFTATLNDLGKRAIICMSAGNEADLNMSISKRFTTEESTLRTFLIPSELYQAISLDSDIEIWSEDGTPVTVTLSTYRTSDGSTTEIISNRTDASGTFSTKTGMITGAGRMTSGIDANNGRYFVTLRPTQAITTSALFHMMLTVSGKPGKKINIYYGGSGDFSSCDIEGFTDGSADESINCSAVADNIISVGSYNTRQVFAVLANNKQYWTAKGTPGAISDFSSYGTTPDGKALPLVVAPGSTIISSFNQYYVEAAGAKDVMTGRAANGSDTSYWGTQDGTSMSCPFVAGVIALWLEADPSMNVDDIKDVILQTSVQDVHTKAKPQAAGAGKIDAAAGLRYILSKSAAIGSVRDDAESRLLITRTDGFLDVTFGGEASFTATLTDLQGRTVANATGADANAQLSTSHLSSGVYILSVKGSGATLTKKITL